MNRSDSSKQRWAVIIFVAAVGIVISAVSIGARLLGEDESEANTVVVADVPVEPVVDARAPDFTLNTVSGERVRLSEFRGQPVLINFWATWCGPCRIEMPFIQDRYEEYRDEGFVVLAINFDESRAQVEAFGEELGLTFPLVLDPGAEVQRLYRNRSYPTSFFVDEQGIIRAHHIGVMTAAQLDENLVKIRLDG